MFGLKDYLAKLPADVEPRDRITLAVLFDHADDAGLCWPSMPRIALLTGCDDRGARRSVQRIVALGLAVVAEVGGGRTSTRYRLSLTPTTTTRGQDGRATTTTRGQDGSAGGAQEVVQGGSRRQGSTTTTTPRSIKEASVEAASKTHPVAPAPAPAQPPPTESRPSLHLLPETSKVKRLAFTPPTLHDVQCFLDSIDGNRDYATSFVDFYASKGWKVGAQPMKDWCAAARRWNRENSPGGRFHHVAQNKPAYVDRDAAETERRKNYYANMDGGGD